MIFEQQSNRICGTFYLLVSKFRATHALINDAALFAATLLQPSDRPASPVSERVAVCTEASDRSLAGDESISRPD
jgi:hypothetical protein